MPIQWFPGHPAQARRQAVRTRADTDVRLEIVAGRVTMLAQALAPHRNDNLKPLRMMVMDIPNVGRSTPINALTEAIARGRGCAVARLSRPHARPLQSGDAGETTAAAE